MVGSRGLEAREGEWDKEGICEVWRVLGCRVAVVELLVLRRQGRFLGCSLAPLRIGMGWSGRQLFVSDSLPGGEA